MYFIAWISFVYLFVLLQFCLSLIWSWLFEVTQNFLRHSNTNVWYYESWNLQFCRRYKHTIYTIVNKFLGINFSVKACILDFCLPKDISIQRYLPGDNTFRHFRFCFLSGLFGREKCVRGILSYFKNMRLRRPKYQKAKLNALEEYDWMSSIFH